MPPETSDLSEKRKRLRQEIETHSHGTEFSPDDVRIVAVTKGFSEEIIRLAREAGFSVVGENRVQEALDKKERLDDSLVNDLEWHFVGHLQSNKVRKVIGEFDLIHSVDRESVIDEFDKRLSRKNLTQDILMQVNVSGEESKHGVTPEKAPDLMDVILSHDTLEPKGLMTMAPYTDDKSVVRKTFEDCRELRKRLEDQFGRKFPVLSMGMTNDYQIALEEGATLLRLGRELFGERPGDA